MTTSETRYQPPWGAGAGARLEDGLAAWLPAQRWFAGKDRLLSHVAVLHSFPFTDGPGAAHIGPDPGPAGLIVVVRAFFDDTSPPEDYHVPLGMGADLPHDGDSSVIIRLDGLLVYDALAHPELTAVLVRRIARGTHSDGLRYESEPPGPAVPDGPLSCRPLGVEQSNSSVVVADRYLLKVFRRLSPGRNPDLEVHRLLHRAGSVHVPRLLGAIEGRMDDAINTFATLQEYVSQASDGWGTALASVRDLLDSDVLPHEAGGDLAAESRRLGQAVATVHRELAAAGGTVPPSRAGLARTAGAMTTRLTTALEAVPALARHEEELRAAFAAVADLPLELAGDTQRVHGDLHLGQVLRATTGWLLIDFEGEPAAPVRERRTMSSPVRDVAGMLRSFDYAAHHRFDENTDVMVAAGARVERWTRRNQDAFCGGYAAEAGTDPRSRGILLRAHLLDKAVYEALYETRHRPGWVSIPLQAVDRLLS